MFCSIIPYTRSIDHTLLDYILPPEFLSSVQVGSAVMIPWGEEQIVGIVADIREELSVADSWKSEIDNHVIKPILQPLCTTPLFAPHELAMIVELAHVCFLRLHVVAQLFLPLGIFSYFEENNFASLESPVSPPTNEGVDDYIIAGTEEQIITYLSTELSHTGWAVILPDGIRQEIWEESIIRNSSLTEEDFCLDIPSKSPSKQAKTYLSILRGDTPILIGSHRTTLKRIGHFRHLYIVYENLSGDIYFHERSIPFAQILTILRHHGFIIHLVTTSPSVRQLYTFLEHTKQVRYL